MSAEPTPSNAEWVSGVWGVGWRLRRAWVEQQACMRAVHALADDLVQSPPGTPPAYAVRTGVVPASWYTLRKNLFSTLFHTMYLVLELPAPRRLLYGKLNYLFRMWVTSADNLLDNEDKSVLPLEMPAQSRVMREVVTVMAADRLLGRILREAEDDGVISRRQADALADESLRLLLPSAAQEATEEGGIVRQASPSYVLETVHVLKTGLLFKLPFLGPDVVETDLDRGCVERLKQGLLRFGVGCQILDDVRDLARDVRERRHNYLLAVLEQAGSPLPTAWATRGVLPGERLYMEAPQAALAAARLGVRYLTEGLGELQIAGLGLQGGLAEKLAYSMFVVLDLEDLLRVCVTSH